MGSISNNDSVEKFKPADLEKQVKMVQKSLSLKQGKKMNKEDQTLMYLDALSDLAH